MKRIQPVSHLLRYFLPFFAILMTFTGSADAKICRIGNRCGNTCIAAWKICHVGQGSAINESDLSAAEMREKDGKLVQQDEETRADVQPPSKEKAIVPE